MRHMIVTRLHRAQAFDRTDVQNVIVERLTDARRVVVRTASEHGSWHLRQCPERILQVCGAANIRPQALLLSDLQFVRTHISLSFPNAKRAVNRYAQERVDAHPLGQFLKKIEKCGPLRWSKRRQHLFAYLESLWNQLVD